MPLIGSDKGATVTVNPTGNPSTLTLILWVGLLIAFAFAALAVGGALAAPFQAHEKVTRAQADLERERAIAETMKLEAQARLEQARITAPAQAEGTLRLFTAVAIALLLFGFSFALYGIGRYAETIERRRIERDRLMFEVARQLPANLARRILLTCPTNETAQATWSQPEPSHHAEPARTGT